MTVRSKKNHVLKNKASPQPKIWPWWQLEINQADNINLKGREQARLSHHIINLRPQINVPPAQSAKPKFQDKEVNLKSVNFLSFVEPKLYSISAFFDRFFKKKYRLYDLSLIFVFEIIIWLLDIIWLAALVFFLKLHQETRILNQSVLKDISNYFSWVAYAITWPFKYKGLKTNKKTAPKIKSVKVFDLQPRALLVQTFIFAILALIITLPLKGVATWQNFYNRGHELMNLASSGFSGLELASSLLAQGNPQLAQEQLRRATDSFNQALVNVTNLSQELSGLLGRLPVASSKLETAKAILSASQEVTAAANLTADTMMQLDQVAAEQNFSLEKSLNILNQAAIELQAKLSLAGAYLQQAQASDLPPEFSSILAKVKLQLSDLEISLASVLALPQLLQQVLVSQEPKTYLIIFQNSTELRPTGGFVGSLALVEFERGEVRSINIPGGGPYDFQGSLKQLIRPPEPLRLVRGTWQLQDANWFYDFPTSAEKIRWFLKESGGPDIQGVVALNSEVVVELLKLTGPIELPQYGKVLTADNFMRETQAAVEIEYDRQANRPKQFIADLAPLLFNKLLSLTGNDMLNLSSLINSSLLNRSIQLYSIDPEVQAKFIEFGWAGQVQDSVSDYLAVVRTNIGGGKTDKVIEERINHQVEISPTGELTVRLNISRSHKGDPHDTFEGRRNVTYLRFYVPSGSNLLTTQGFTPPPSNYYRDVPAEAEYDLDLVQTEVEKGWDTSSGTRVTEEYGKTVFGNWLSVSPGETRTASLVYRLPFRLQAGATWQDLRRYSIFFQRQSGVGLIDFRSKIIWPDTFRLRWQESSQQPIFDNNGFEMKSNWQSDEYYGLILEKYR